MTGTTNSNNKGYSVEVTTDGDWTVEKHSDGRMIAYAQLEFTAVNGNAVTGTNLTNQWNTFPIPNGFIANPFLVCTGFVYGDIFSHITYAHIDYTALSNGLSCRITHHTNTTGNQGLVKPLAIGRWRS